MHVGVSKSRHYSEKISLSIHQVLLGIYYVLKIIPGAEDTGKQADKILALTRLRF